MNENRSTMFYKYRHKLWRKKCTFFVEFCSYSYRLRVPGFSLRYNIISNNYDSKHDSTGLIRLSGLIKK